jgi:outer membrane protein TolC
MEAVDFPQAVARALRANPAVAAAGYDYAAAQQDVDAARGRYLPELAFGLQFVRTDIPAEAFALTLNQGKLQASDFQDVDNFNNPPPRNDYITTFTLEQPLFVPRVYVGHKMARAEADAKGLDLSRTREETVYRVLTAYLEVLTAKAYVSVAERGLADAREHRRLAEAAEGAGTGLTADVLRAKVSVAAAEGGKVTAESRLELARRGLSLAMGRGTPPPWTSRVRPPGSRMRGPSRSSSPPWGSARTCGPSRCASRTPGTTRISGSRSTCPAWASSGRTSSMPRRGRSTWTTRAGRSEWG